MSRKNAMNDVDKLEKQRDEILEALDADEFQSVADSETEMKTAVKAAKAHVVRDSRVNIRISKADLNMIKRRAIQEGLPFQTFLASVIHLFATGRLSRAN